ncbi:MAG TPA: helix-turn-helix transcriptional regulator [Solirubrobacterales bacterium]|nr:helix-turn-helix transcriptional regulator [Solirubrobacterales bacterium]
MDLKKRFAQNLIEQREKKGLTPGQLAEAASVDLDHLESIEGGHEEPLLEPLVKLAASLGVTTDELLR